MLINEVCRKCSLTKKAVEYYIGQELISPAIQENGYRVFSEEDLIRLKRISTLRSLGLSAAEIRSVLSEQAETALKEISEKKNLEITVLREKQKLLQELAQNRDWNQVQSRLQQLEKKQSVLEQLIHVFPGYYGRYIALHFAPYLNEPVMTDKQQEAFDTIITFLDNTCFDIPDELKKYLDETAVHFDESFAERLSTYQNDAIQDTEKYITEHREEIEHYIKFKQSDEYKATPAYRLEQSLRQFTRNSGYNDVFIPAMCRLSRSYQKYYEKLQESNERFLQEYPQYMNII